MADQPSRDWDPNRQIYPHEEFVPRPDEDQDEADDAVNDEQNVEEGNEDDRADA
jgi:hypothetical protein